MNRFSGAAKLNPILNNLKNVRDEGFQRPNHSDFKSSSELAASTFSGIRDNRISMMFELWVGGEMVKSISYDAVRADPFALTKAQMEYFGVA